jgi:hypothetical protein
MSDYEKVKEWRMSKRKPCPGGCETEVAHDTKLCRQCTGKKRTEAALDKTVAQIKKESKSLRWTDQVRAIARNMHKFDKCVECGYDKIVHICHRIDIAAFPDTATVRQINAPSNVVGLCPNHHWEYDHGFLESDKVFKPVVSGKGAELTFTINGESRTFVEGKDFTLVAIDRTEK